MSLQRVFVGMVAGASLLVASSGVASAAVKNPSGKEQATSQQKQGDERSVAGKITSIDAKELTLANGEQVRLTQKTRYLSGKRSISRADLKSGEEVRAEYMPSKKLAYATQVQVEKGGASSARSAAKK